MTREVAVLTRNPLLLKAHHEMGAVGLGERFAFALERNDVRARRRNRLGWNDRLNLVPLSIPARVDS